MNIFNIFHKQKEKEVLKVQVFRRNLEDVEGEMLLQLYNEVKIFKGEPELSVRMAEVYGEKKRVIEFEVPKSEIEKAEELVKRIQIISPIYLARII